MKRYLYILLSAVVMFAACDSKISIDGKKIIAHVISEPITIETTDTSATISTAKPHIVVNGVKEEGATVYMEYWVEGDESAKQRVDTFTENSLTVITFTLENIAPNTTYYAHFAVGNAEYGEKSGDIFTFTTKEHIPEVEMTSALTVDAKGIVATAYLRNVAYMVDGANAALSAATLEYARMGSDEWAVKELKGSDLGSGSMSVALPFEGCDYLEENRNYQLRLTLYPEADNFEPLTSDIVEFKTQFAEITANIAKPTLEVNGENIRASVENIEVFYDGISEKEYQDSRKVKYYFYYRVKGEEKWSIIEVEATAGNISATIQAKEGNTYEFMAVIVAGGMQKARESEVAEIVVPKSETPTPPVGGEGDTSTITGTWHLTSWRGAEPSFDIYLDITADGVVTLWQRLESREWECYYSAADFVDGLLCGTYTDGVAWGASYSVTLGDDTMTWVDNNDTTDISVYTRAELPEDMSVVVTRAAESRTRFL